MARRNYRKIFDDLYEKSSPEARALFDNPATRANAPELYASWQKSEIMSQDHSKGIHPETEARASVYRELDDFLWFCEFMGGAAQGN